MTAIADRYRTLASQFEARVAAVRPEDWSNPSPCDGWTARDVVAHVIDVHAMMLRPLSIGRRDAPTPGDDPLGAFRAARADVQRVLDDPALADTEYDGMFGRTRVADTVDRFLGFDLVVHGWDLATATGQDPTMPADDVDRLLAFVEQVGTATMRENGVTGPEVEVPADASAQDRLLGLLGRHPA
jgi:uncharacterized protein (TIGR03086 family)